jgi:hypothetical protein
MGIPLPTKIDEETERSEQRDFYVPDGTYLVRVLEADEKDRSDGNGTYLNMVSEIVDPEKMANDKAIGLKVFDLLTMSEKAMWRIVNMLDACYPPKFNGGEIPNNIVGRLMVLKVKNETYNGKENLRVKQYHTAADWDGALMRLDSEGREIGETAAPKAAASKAAAPKAAANNGKSGKPRASSDDDVAI